MRAVCLANLILLHLITLTISGEQIPSKCNYLFVSEMDISVSYSLITISSSLSSTYGLGLEACSSSTSELLLKLWISLDIW
jgi:hypothetical protein